MPPVNTISWAGTLTAVSSIAHGGETRGTITLLRRELLALPDGRRVYVPIISGNTFRGRLRRLGEELLRNVLRYETELHPAAAHALRGGGALAKTSHEPLSGHRLQALRNLVPQIGVFGAAGGGTIIDGALDVGKVIPQVAETNHITGAAATASAFTATQLEGYTRQDDSDSHNFADVFAPDGAGSTGTAIELLFDDTGRPEPSPRTHHQMRFHLETFPTGTVFTTWLRLRRPTDLEVAFFLDVLDAFTIEGRLGGRVGIGHGQVHVDLVPNDRTHPRTDWRAHVEDHRTEILTSLKSLA